MKPESISMRFPESDEERRALIDAAPDSASDPESAYDPSDPAAVESFWRGAVVQPPRRRQPQTMDVREQSQPVTLRLSREVLEYFHAGEQGWERRIDRALQDYVEEHR
ncbi:MAG: BrnA antitoxin family protein [Thiocapsa sp.]|uniref:BrnA antitoxin family protein n=1 Tax=Thiocapsa sp. TaxID=2024551 RepID=UPI001BCE8CC1|nr:BrnA antitoxin family protein [Thiocapsa sp.]QVL51024.1 MAG: BrnA antitoxin family protein [Thiocapsa sp.]